MPMLNNWILSGLFFITMKTFEITKDLLVEMAGWGNTKDNKKIRELFPEAFEPELKTGIWYKSNDGKGFFLFLDEIDKNNTEDGFVHNFCKSYGFYNFNKWDNSEYRSYELFVERMTPATEEEVFEKLKAEAKRQGFENKYLKIELENKRYELESEKGSYQYLSGILFYQGAPIFNNGIWAEICITKEEAEKELGKKII